MKITKRDLSKMIQEELKATKHSNGYRNPGLEKLSAANKKKVVKKAPKKTVKEDNYYQPGEQSASGANPGKELKAKLIAIQGEVQKSNLDPLVTKQVYLHLRQAIMAIK